MTLIIRILFFCILCSLAYGQSESGTSDAEENWTESMTSNPTEATDTTFQTTVDSVSTDVMNNCPPCQTTVCEPPPTCPSCSAAPESTTTCPPCSTIAPEPTTTYTPCEEPITPTCLPCETTVQTTCPPCTTMAPSAKTMSPEELCNYLDGEYNEILCHYTCKRHRPHKIIFQNFKEIGDPCKVAGKNGTCQPGMVCRLPPIPRSWW